MLCISVLSQPLQSGSQIQDSKFQKVMAERVGFEPTERFPVHSISSAANSTTLAPLRKAKMKDEGGSMKGLLLPEALIHPSTFIL
jgi:hypothetical protein